MDLESAIHTFLLSQPNLNTRKAYRSGLIPMQSYIGTARPIEKVNVADVIEYSATLYDHDYAQATIRKHVITIKAFFNFLKKNGIIDKSPADAIKRPKRQRNIDRNKAMSDEKLKTLLEYVKFSPRHNALVRFLADTGCRIGGANSLLIEHIDFHDCQAIVTEKGSKTRMVAFGPTTADAIKQWIRERPDDACDYVFNQTAKPIKTAALASIFRRACINAGIGSWGPHSLRHRKGYQLSDSKVSLSVAATVLGHESTETTLHYYPADWERAEIALKQLALRDVTKPFPNVVKMPNKKVQ